MSKHVKIATFVLVLAGAAASGCDDDKPSSVVTANNSTNNSTNNQQSNNSTINNSTNNANNQSNNATDLCEGVDCSGLNDACTVGACDAATGECIAQPAANGAACDDGDACTGGDACEGGVCAGSAVDCSGLNDACNVGVCNAASGQCEAQPANEGAACDDGEACNTGEVCTGGVCGGGAAVDCSGLDDQCNVGACDPATGACVAQAANEGAACDDGEACNTGEVCTAGACGGGAAVDCSGLDDACNVGACDPATGECGAQPANEGAVCDDGDLCTLDGTCAEGACVLAPAVECAPNEDPCLANFCDSASGQCAPVPANDGMVCDDSNLCTQGETCSAGTCGGGQPANNGMPCDDGDLCTEADACTNGQCTGPRPSCDDLSQACFSGTCNTISSCVPDNPDAVAPLCSLLHFVGNPGGSPLEAGCPEGQVMTGFTAARTTHGFYGGISLTCSIFQCSIVTVDDAGVVHTTPGEDITPQGVCTSPAPSETARCPDGSALVGVDGSTWIFGAPYLTTLQARCAPLTVSAGPVGDRILQIGEGSLIEPVVGEETRTNEVTPFEPIVCPPGSLVSRHLRRSGDVFDGLQLFCTWPDLLFPGGL